MQAVRSLSSNRELQHTLKKSNKNLYTTFYNYVKILTKEMSYRIVIAIVECDFHKLIAHMTPMCEPHNAAVFSR